MRASGVELSLLFIRREDQVVQRQAIFAELAAGLGKGGCQRAVVERGAALACAGIDADEFPRAGTGVATEPEAAVVGAPAGVNPAVRDLIAEALPQLFGAVIVSGSALRVGGTGETGEKRKGDH